ncbi:MAG: hypothetical protein J6D07_05995 [Mogibacterium sp.]|nr:hypothetical protein [Mogibacterium sp.]
MRSKWNNAIGMVMTITSPLSLLSLFVVVGLYETDTITTAEYVSLAVCSLLLMQMYEEYFCLYPPVTPLSDYVLSVIEKFVAKEKEIPEPHRIPGFIAHAQKKLQASPVVVLRMKLRGMPETRDALDEMYLGEKHDQFYEYMERIVNSKGGHNHAA